jgi:AcrR family transcriptional regulator
VNRCHGPRQVGPGVSGCNPRAGRRPDRSQDEVIQAAVLQVLAEEGYRGLSMDDAVARTAGSGKATIYRRWSGKEDLLASAVQATSIDSLVIPDTGPLRDDLVHLHRCLADVPTGPGGDANRALLGVLPERSALPEAYRRGPVSQQAGARSQLSSSEQLNGGDLLECGLIPGRRSGPGDPVEAVAPR